MSKKRLRVLGILLICTMLLSALSLTALADEETAMTDAAL